MAKRDNLNDRQNLKRWTDGQTDGRTGQLPMSQVLRRHNNYRAHQLVPFKEAAPI